MSDFVERINKRLRANIQAIADDFGITPAEVEKQAAASLARLRALPAQPAQGEAGVSAMISKLDHLRTLARCPGDPIREPRRGHINRYHEALSQAWESGAITARTPHPPTPPDSAGELDALVAKLDHLRTLSRCPGDPIREPRRSHINRYHSALAEAWETGAMVAALRAKGVR